MTVKSLLLPKKRLMPLFVVCVLMAIALLYALFFNIHAASLVADIFVPLVLVVIILTAWLSRKQLNSLYLIDEQCLHPVPGGCRHRHGDLRAVLPELSDGKHTWQYGLS